MNKKETKAAISCLENDINHLKDQARRMCTHSEEVLNEHPGFISYSVNVPTYYTKDCSICVRSIMITKEEYYDATILKHEEAIKTLKEKRNE